MLLSPCKYYLHENERTLIHQLANMLAENEGLSDHKIHHGSGALAALASNSLDGSHSTTSSTHSAEDSKSPVVSSFPSCSLPMNISSTNSLKAQASSEQLIKSPHSGSGRLSFLGCFSSGGTSPFQTPNSIKQYYILLLITILHYYSFTQRANHDVNTLFTNNR